jgi:hypothetical protein
MINDGNGLKEHHSTQEFTGRDMFFCLLVALSVFASVAYFTSSGRGRAIE